jgi:AcrR family transcriptional regulator
MNAAERLFLEYGVAQTTIEQITSAADVAKGTFYLYFSSKEDLRAALGERFAQKHLESVKAALAEQSAGAWAAQESGLRLKAPVAAGAVHMHQAPNVSYHRFGAVCDRRPAAF